MDKRIRIVACVLGLGVAAAVHADGYRADPAAACGFLAGLDLATRGGYQANGDIYECRSRRKDLIGGGEVHNRIRYRAWGDAQAVSRLELDLEVNSLTAVQHAHHKMLEYARELVREATQAPLPGEAEAAILAATSGRWALAGYTLGLRRVVLDSPRYELHLYVE